MSKSDFDDRVERFRRDLNSGDVYSGSEDKDEQAKSMIAIYRFGADWARSQAKAWLKIVMDKVGF